MSDKLVLVSHHLCPYVQRASIALDEKGVPFERRTVDLSDKPDWFTEISPLGKVPLLIAGSHVIFESAVILEYLEETQPAPLHPGNPEHRAEHRSWIEFGSSLLNDIAGLYNAPDAQQFDGKWQAMQVKFSRLESRLGGSDWFDPAGFSLVDAAYAPIFRYFDTFEATAGLYMFDSFEKLQRWRTALAARPSVIAAVGRDYPDRLAEFLRARGSHMSRLMSETVPV